MIGSPPVRPHRVRYKVRYSVLCSLREKPVCSVKRYSHAFDQMLVGFIAIIVNVLLSKLDCKALKFGLTH